MAKSTNRASLSRSQIVDTALALIAEVGVDQLSMRQLSTELGASLGSTYRHVPTKEALLLLCGRTLYGRSYRPRDADEEPMAWLREHTVSLYEELARHPGMAAYVVQDDGVAAPEVVREVRAALLELGHTSASSEMIGLVLTYYSAGALLANSERFLSAAGVPDARAVILAGFDFILRSYRPDAQEATDPAWVLVRRRVTEPPLSEVSRALAGQPITVDPVVAPPPRAGGLAREVEGTAR
ncbi:MAG: putative TetR-family transcriptional regulator [Frankiales bacterium]|nr:putative TetR-family transcriptional regulator [Frankiales bacterium]